MGQIYIVGSGVSCHLGMQRWTDLLKEVASSHLPSNKADEVASILSYTGQEYVAASRLAELLGDNTLEICITKLLKDRQETIPRPNQKLLNHATLFTSPELSGIVTTNWDTLLTDFLIDNCAFKLLIWPDSPNNEGEHIREVLQCAREKRFIWHLHGVLGKSRLIITERQRSEREKAILKNQTFKTILAQGNRIGITGTALSDPLLQKLKCELINLGASIVRVKWEGDESYDYNQTPLLTEQSFSKFSAFHEAEIRAFARGNHDHLVLLDPKSPDDLLRNLIDVRGNEVLVHAIRQTPRFMRMAGKAAIEGFRCKDTEGAASIIAMVLTKAVDCWDPNRRVIHDLTKIVRVQLESGPLGNFHVIQPLAFVLGQKGQTELAGAYLRTLLSNIELRFLEHLKTTYHFVDLTSRYHWYDCFFAERENIPILGGWDAPSLMHDIYNLPLEMLPYTRMKIKRILPAIANFDRSLARDIDTEMIKQINIRKQDAKGI